MLLIENTLFGELNKEDIAIERCKEFQNKKPEKKAILAFSGGKDSIVLYHIMKRSGIDFTPIYSPPSVDAPELKYFMDKYYPEVFRQPYHKDENGREITMWTLIPKKLLPPTRRMRYCCEELKERTGEAGDTVFTGVRWAESNKRSKMPMVGFWKEKIMIRPLIDWSDEDIWEYIRKYNIPYCELYNQGFTRIGCIGCPLNSKNQKKELERYPKIKAAYIRAFDRMIKNRIDAGKVCNWKNGQEVMDWWLGECRKKEIDGQNSLFIDEFDECISEEYSENESGCPMF